MKYIWNGYWIISFNFWNISWAAFRVVFHSKSMNDLFSGMELFEGEGKQDKCRFLKVKSE